jgi:peroxiredoxin Q/BCP
MNPDLSPLASLSIRPALPRRALLAASIALSSLVVACATTPTTPAAASAAPSATITAPDPAGGGGPMNAAAAANAAAGPPAAADAIPNPPTGGEELVGKPAPDFTASAQNGTTIHLAALKGKTVVLYFYPKDETPGCTKEACSFRDAWEAIAKSGAVLIGISADSDESHKNFAAHHKLPFLLISDPDGAIGRTYGVPFQGRHHRETFVIGPDGAFRKVYREVDVTVHAQQVLADVSRPG